MLFAFHLVDRADAGDLRTRVRPEHKAYLAQVAERIAFAGPLTGDDGQSMLGSLLVIDFADRAAALAWLAREPFTARRPVRPDASPRLPEPVAAARRVRRRHRTEEIHSTQHCASSTTNNGSWLGVTHL